MNKPFPLLALGLSLALSGCEQAQQANQTSAVSTVESVSETAGKQVAQTAEAATRNKPATAVMADSGTLADKDPLRAYKTEKVAEHTYVVHGPLEMPNVKNLGFMNNPGFVVTEKSVIVVDPGSSYGVGKALLKRISAVTKNPVTHVLISHVHGDHWLASQAILEAYPAARAYAHREMIKLAADGAGQQWVNLMENLTEGATAGTKAVVPEVTVTDMQELTVDDLHIRVYLSDFAHTTTDAMFEVVEDCLLFAGDVAIYQRIARMDDGSFRGNKAFLERMLARKIKTIVPGHGPTGGEDRLQAYHDYLDIVYQEAARLLDEGLADFEMKSQIQEKLGSFANWAGFEDELGKHISLSVLEAEQAAFE